MTSNVTDRDLVRRYLLGRLDEQAEVEGKLSERILFDNEMAEIVDSVEDDIVEEYLDGSLDSADRRDVETYFLQAPERNEKLRFAKLLRRHFETKSSHHSRTEHDSLLRPPLAWSSYLRTYGQMAALLLLGISSVIYITAMRRGHTRLQAELLQERDRSASLKQEAQLLQPPIVPLTLVADRSRSAGGRMPAVQIKASTRRLIVEIVLQGGVSNPYDVRLEAKGSDEPLWSAKLLPIISPSGDARLIFDMPTRDIKSGVYSFVLSSASPATTVSRHYDFQIARY
jgi:hypothetical protein